MSQTTLSAVLSFELPVPSDATGNCNSSPSASKWLGITAAVLSIGAAVVSGGASLVAEGAIATTLVVVGTAGAVVGGVCGVASRSS